MISFILVLNWKSLNYGNGGILVVIVQLLHEARRSRRVAKTPWYVCGPKQCKFVDIALVQGIRTLPLG